MESTRPTEDVAAGVVRIVLALGKRVGQEDPQSLTLLRDVEAQLQASWSTAIAQLRANGYTDGELAEVLGVSRQAVSKRWPGGGRYRGAAGRYRS